MKAGRISVWLLFCLVIVGYYLMWNVPSSIVLPYAATRDAIIFNTFLALVLGSMVLWTSWSYIPVAGSWPRQVLYFLFIVVILGVYNVNRLPAITHKNLLVGVGWDDVPATGLIMGMQTASLLFALLITVVRFRFSVKGK